MSFIGPSAVRLLGVFRKWGDQRQLQELGSHKRMSTIELSTPPRWCSLELRANISSWEL